MAFPSFILLPSLELFVLKQVGLSNLWGEGKHHRGYTCPPSVAHHAGRPAPQHEHSTCKPPTPLLRSGWPKQAAHAPAPAHGQPSSPMHDTGQGVSHYLRDHYTWSLKLLWHMHCSSPPCSPSSMPCHAAPRSRGREQKPVEGREAWKSLSLH